MQTTTDTVTPSAPPVQTKQLRYAPDPAPPAYGRYGALRGEVPEEDREWDIEDPDGDPLEDFEITPPQGSASQSRRQHEERDYMEGVPRGVLGGAYMGEPRRSRLDFEEEMDVAAVGTLGGRRWEPRSTSRPAFKVSKATDAALWEDLKDIRPRMYDGNPLNLDHFLEKPDHWGGHSLKRWTLPWRRAMSSNISDGACRRCSKNCTSWQPKRKRSQRGQQVAE